MLKIGKNSEFDKFSWQRQKAIVQLFNGKTLKEVSQQTKVHRLNLVSMEQKEDKLNNDSLSRVKPCKYGTEAQKSIQQ